MKECQLFLLSSRSRSQPNHRRTLLQSATVLKPLTGEVNDIDYPIKLGPVKERDISGIKPTVRF